MGQSARERWWQLGTEAWMDTTGENRRDLQASPRAGTKSWSWVGCNRLEEANWVRARKQGEFFNQSVGMLHTMLRILKCDRQLQYLVQDGLTSSYLLL